MTAIIINGRQIADQLCHGITRDVADFQKKKKMVPCLAVLLVGDHPPSQVYIKNKQQACTKVGIRSEAFNLSAQATQAQVLATLDILNRNDSIHGILVQLPLPSHIDASIVISRVAPHKDVDGLHPQNLGLLLAGQPCFIPCTPLGCLHLIHSVMPNVTGKRVVMIGRSLLVGRPTGLLLGAENATVVQAHSETVDLEGECQRADIIISATGQPSLVTARHVKPGCVVIDVGITRVSDAKGNNSIKGDVCFDEVSPIAGYITPVPGGVGPMTVAYLLHNTLKAAMQQA
jgi:methylenetetrahydrofolate dehydrogenase (NADP+)/methenyltetrahydrofolate cyclohydrolase